MNDFIHFRCSGCTARIKAPSRLLGESRRCPDCGWNLVVRVTQREESYPLLVAADAAARSGAESRG